MGTADRQYLDLARDILDNGYYDNNRTGMPTKKLFGKMFEFDLQKEFPILTTKKVNFEALVKEILWIYVKQSNIVAELGSKIWDQWMMRDGSIGRGYGFQVAKFDQVNKLINTIRTNPQDRAMIISLWNIEDLPFMSLRPCAFMTMWDVADGFLNCTLIQRSSDLPLGIGFNTPQYAVLIHMIAQICDLKVGKFVHYMNNVHIYENQFEGMELQLTREPMEQPKLWLNPNIRNFADFTLDDIKLIDYKSHPAIKMKVSK